MPNYDLMLDAYGDITITNGDLQFQVDPRLALKQKMEILFRTFTTEWWWKQSWGGLNKQLIFTKGVSKNIIDAWFLARINDFDEVIQILNFQSSVDNVNRIYTLSFTVLTEDGSLELEIDAGFIPARSELIYPSQEIYEELLEQALVDVAPWWGQLTEDQLLILDLPFIMETYYTYSWHYHTGSFTSSESGSDSFSAAGTNV